MWSLVRYSTPVTGKGRLNQTGNPEVTVNVDEVNIIINRTAMKLRQTSVQLRNAFNVHPLWFLDTDGTYDFFLRQRGDYALRSVCLS